MDKTNIIILLGNNNMVKNNCIDYRISHGVRPHEITFNLIKNIK